MANESDRSAVSTRQIRSRPHERTMERLVFAAWIGELIDQSRNDASTKAWLELRFRDELDRRRALERRWRQLFWANRYIILSGSLALPVLITASKQIENFIS